MSRLQSWSHLQSYAPFTEKVSDRDTSGQLYTPDSFSNINPFFSVPTGSYFDYYNNWREESQCASCEIRGHN
jgi:hypothetical protein